MGISQRLKRCLAPQLDLVEMLMIKTQGPRDPDQREASTVQPERITGHDEIL